MRSSFIRLVAVVLLAVAIPMQGMAAVAAGQCMAFGHHDSAATSDHEHGADGHDHADGHDQAADAQGDEGKSSHCGPCTACCASASIAAPAGLFVQFAPSNIKYLLSQLAPPGVEPHRFDRPPLAL